MREFKFRGISKKTGKWIYGYYLKNRGIDFIAPDEFVNGKTWGDYEVIPESVMQFSGLYDKNKKEVYEGDVLRFYDEDIPLDVVLAFVDGALMAVYTSKLDVRCSWAVNDMIIIGNIHENPELLKVEGGGMTKEEMQKYESGFNEGLMYGVLLTVSEILRIINFCKIQIQYKLR